ncbi:hypothetical protein TRAPUB_12426 [Trametes pubescens]|uniref:DUF7726 domain-containing protein n=1 Tax=Trametes pubescens TaxID=154538 RepID=A0A1M2VTY1_TRAPU|nr:hypothetical protein TRAPUB_12426 [Trametes pubescens]
MPPKRKSEVLEPVDLTVDTPEAESEDDYAPAVVKPAAKKARKSDVAEGSSSGAKKGKTADEPKKKWFEIKLEGEEEGDLKIYDDCNDIRRKIKALQKQPDFKVTHWLQAIGNINNNSYQRFMKASGPTGGASNGTYYAAYVYFEKVRIAEGKKKTPKRIRNEQEYLSGMPTEERRGMWVRG